MALKDYLKPKSRKSIVDDFLTKWITEGKTSSSQYYDSKSELQQLIRFHLRERRTRVWAVCSFIWMFGIAMIINGAKALEEHYFWFPLKLAEKSMFNFINIFWIITWFAIAAFIIIYGIVIVVRSYEDY